MAESGKAFDLMNPPASISGGSTAFQEYPKHLHLADGSVVVVASREEEAAHTPAPAVEEPVKRGPGRPRADAA